MVDIVGDRHDVFLVRDFSELWDYLILRRWREDYKPVEGPLLLSWWTWDPSFGMT